jgi:antitoxin (DNA-binding transcriptional repressor) of toxin-antitoxin stability system
MTITVKIGEAKARFSELIQRVEAGEEIVIARGPDAVARLVKEQARPDAKEAVERLLARREALRAEGVTVTREEIRAWIDEGRK